MFFGIVAFMCVCACYLGLLALTKRIEKLEQDARENRIFKQDVMSHIKELNITMEEFSKNLAEVREFTGYHVSQIAILEEKTGIYGKSDEKVGDLIKEKE